MTAELLNSARAGDEEAMGEMIEENSGLIWSVARRFFGRGVDPEDLYQLGCVGFIKAVRGFDDSFGTQFSTYAVPKISGEIRRFLRDDGMVKVSRSVKERANYIRVTRNTLEQRLGREPTISEISGELGLTPEEIASCEVATTPTDSLQRETGDDGFTLEQMIGDYGAEDRLIEKFSLGEAIEKLNDREKKVILLRFYRGMTQSNAAQILGISQVQVSRTEKRALENLRNELLEKA
jgi:RNA polymerase sporulation-specific sigma factor